MRSRVEFKMKRLGAMRANQWQWFQLSGKSKSNERAKQRWKLLRNTLLAIRIRCNRNLKVTPYSYDTMYIQYWQLKFGQGSPIN